MPGPEDILQALGGPKEPIKHVKEHSISAEGHADLEDFKPPLGLKPPTDLLNCPCCGTLHREFYQEQFTNLPAVTCKCGVKMILDIDNHNTVLSDNWNKRHQAARANDEVIRWLAILDMNMRDDDGVIQGESHHDPYVFGILMELFRSLMVRKHQLEVGMMCCPFCGSPDFIDRRSHLQCANMECSAVVPVDYFTCMVSGKNPHAHFTEVFAKSTPETKPTLPSVTPDVHIEARKDRPKDRPVKKANAALRRPKKTGKKLTGLSGKKKRDL
jgi:hypothetical protein